MTDARRGVVAPGPPVPAPYATGAVPHYVQLRGIRLYYETEGQGPPLLLLHGGGGSGAQFEKQRPEFKKRHYLVVPDSRAQGRTTDGEGPLTYHDMAEDTIALMDELGIGRADVMGWSDGGNIGLDIAIHHPDRIAHLVTFGSNANPRGLKDSDAPPAPESQDPTASKIDTMWRTLPDFRSDELGSIRAHALICAGENDLIRPEHTTALAKAIPGARLWIVPDATHAAILERPELVNPRVLAFLADDPLGQPRPDARDRQ